MENMFVVIAGTSVVIQADEALAFFLAPLKEFYQGFLNPKGPTTAEITLSYDQCATLRKFTALPTPLLHRRDARSTRIIRQVEERYPLEASVLIGYLNGVLAYNVHSRQGHLHLFRSSGKNFLLGSLHKLLFLFLAIIMAEQDRFMIHGAGLRIGSEGYLFPGVSGAGKSTVAGQVERGAVLSDDAPVVTQNKGVFTIHSSPFSQINLFEPKTVNHHRKTAPLASLIFLKQANHLDLKCRDRRSALAELLREHVHGFEFMEGTVKVRAFRFCCDLCASVPVFDLYFRNDNRFLALLGRQNRLEAARRD
ncbi:MAG: hypothetical protein ACYC7J_11610 [Syntrophales bacterium]